MPESLKRNLPQFLTLFFLVNTDKIEGFTEVEDHDAIHKE